jgi:hypothetical protein
VFFAIPLATLFKAVNNAWPRGDLDQGGAVTDTAPTQAAL